ncbi:HupE/UreJ family protein [Roseibium sp. Sym1]|uniref:HupE/UreJ family protein n=1 Tax=Roseibium sp. Sym1 TaxID=3016006 RepID=UPI0022B5C3FA|nr:HupE/UreJ family protein [Roseibium sp. Sym1]
MTRLVPVLLLLCVIWLPQKVSAHALDPGYLELVPFGPDTWRVTWRVPDVGGKPMPIDVRLPEPCGKRPPAPPAFDGRAWSSSWIADCPGGLAGGTLRIDGLERTSTDVLVRYELTPGEGQVHRLTASEPGFSIPGQAGIREIFTSYTGLGITHILEGLDHLLFVFALLLLVRGRARLFWAITAFTAAHSLTLAAATLGILTLPSPPVEAVIALSIVFLAYELTLPPGRRDRVTENAPWIVTFGFGLVHGLGFAGALREIGLPEGDIPLALLAFNFGVELGQILFVMLVLAAFALVTRLVPAVLGLRAGLVRVTSYLIGSMAAFWVIERIAAF